MYACITKIGRGFFEVACEQENRHPILATHPYRSAISELVCASAVGPRVLHRSEPLGRHRIGTMFDYAQGNRDTCYHEAAHAVFVHHCPHLELRYVEVNLEPRDGRQDIAFYSGTRTFPSVQQAMDYAVGSLVGEYAVYRARSDNERTGYKSFEVFVEDADPDGEFRDLDEYDYNLMELYMERLQCLRHLEEERERYEPEFSIDDREALIDLRFVTRQARMSVESSPSLESLEQFQEDKDLLRWRELRSCYSDAAQKAFGFLDERWAEINAVAEPLMEVGRLEGSEVCHIIESLREEKEDI